MICHLRPRLFLPGPPNRTFGVIAGIICLAVTTVSSATPPRLQFNHDAFARHIQEQLRRNVPTLSPPKMQKPDAFLERLGARFEPRKGVAFWMGCGWGSVSLYDFEQRQTRLPDDPVLILAAGYLHCQRIDISILDPRVPVAFYPTGHFGDFVYENELITDRLEFADESVLRQIFDLIVESTAGVDENWSILLGAGQTELNVADFRKETGFVPEMLIEFVGEGVVRVEMDFTRRQVLIQSGDRWESYTLDPGSAAALQDLVLAEQTRQRQSGE